jgi:hypothetical protein
MSLREALFCSVMAATVIAAVPASAQLMPQASGVPCDAFQRLPNGMWQITKPVTFGNPGASVSMGPGAAIGPGVIIAGIRLWDLLEQQCH